MKVVLYQNTSEYNKVLKNLTNEKTIDDVVFKDVTSVMTPKIILSSDVNLKQYNYVYIAELKRYYYITDISLIGNNRYTISCSVDVLMSYKDYVQSFDVIIDRCETDWEPYLNDNEIKRLEYNNIILKKFPNNPFNKNMSYILTTVGRSIETDE